MRRDRGQGARWGYRPDRRRPIHSTARQIFDAPQCFTVAEIAESVAHMDAKYIWCEVTDLLEPMALELGMIDETASDRYYRKMLERLFPPDDDDGIPA